jgi:HK97 gp10 family phage protein
MSAVRGLKKLAALLREAQVDAAAANALRRGAEQLADTVRAELSGSGDGPHEMPRIGSGALRESISVSANGAVAVVGSISEVALFQETGTRTMPPRPFLAPAAALQGAAIAHEVGAAVVAALRGE